MHSSIQSCEQKGGKGECPVARRGSVDYLRYHFQEGHPEVVEEFLHKLYEWLVGGERDDRVRSMCGMWASQPIFFPTQPIKSMGLTQPIKSPTWSH